MCCTTAIAARTGGSQTSVEATTIAELEAQKEENNKKIKEYEAQLAQYDEDQKEAEAYQAALQEKITVLNSNMQILDEELETIKENIYNLENEIAELETTIDQQEEDIEEGLEQFKLRLRAMYVNGNDSLASALVGATDFYDLLSKYELISCVARHDDELVNNLKAELEAYNQNLETLETQKAAEEQAQTEKEEKQAEMQTSMDELNAAYADTEAEKERIAAEKEQANKSIDELEADNQRADEAEAEIQRAAEEAKKKAEEAAAAAAKEAAAAQKNTSNSSTSSSGTSSSGSGTSSSDSSSGGSSSSTDSGASVSDSSSYSGTSFGWPCPGYYYISSGYGSRWGTTHRGMDIAQNAGAAVVASQSGTVIKVYSSCTHNYGKSANCCGNGYGNYVLISHGDGTYTTMYAHMASVSVSVGDYVSKGQTVGYVGSTGYSTGFHLHFEIRKNGSAVNPSGYLNY